MDKLPTLEWIGLISSVIVLLLYFALQRIGARIGEDVYAFLKGMALGAWRFLFRLRQAQPAPDPVEGLPDPRPLADEGRRTAIPAPEPPSQPDPIPPTPSPKPVMFSTPRGRYRDLRLLAKGEVCRVYRAEMEEIATEQRREVALKIATAQDARLSMQNEVGTLRLLHEGAGTYAKHLPQVLDQFRTAEGLPGTVFDFLDGYTLEQLRARFPQGVEPRHGLWILRRCLSALGYVHSRGLLHGHLTPAHILVRPQDHNIWLLGWSHAIQRPGETGQGFQVRDPIYGPPEAHNGKSPLPASDLWSLARCMIWLLGGDPASETLPAAVPERLERFLRFLLKESPVQRPQDAWELYRALEKIRDELFGPHRFVEFIVP